MLETLMRRHLNAARWLMVPRAVKRPRLRLICLPYAGGNPDIFRPWVKHLDADVELLAVRLPGRGSRIQEAPYDDWPSLTEDCLQVLEPFVSEPHAFYGHSFGGRLAYELIQRMQLASPCLTRRLFVSGCRSPDSPQARPYLHQLSKADFRRALKTMGATPSVVLESEEVLSLMLPALQSDMRLAEIWCDWHPVRLAIPVHVYYGHQDPVDNLASMAGWSNYTSSSCEFIGIDAGHFFLESNREQLLDHMTMRMRD